MNEYRILKETTTNTNKVTYYIERKKKFLIWEWWSKETCYHPRWGELYISFDSYEEAKERLDRFTDKIITEVVK
tara:strand:+ start:272 stop:493 length:222 start_codon:yes stop_codon:yes gene_type:complete